MNIEFDSHFNIGDLRKSVGRHLFPPTDMPNQRTHRPTDSVPIINYSIDDYFVFSARWGLAPHFLKSEPTPPLITLPSEGLASRANYSKLLKHYRCLIPASAYYDQKWKISHVNGKPLMIAGVCANTPSAGRTCAILTTQANDLISSVNSRMPVILGPSQYEEWLAYRYGAKAKEYEPFLTPCPSKLLKLEAADDTQTIQFC